jgi:hypothetical protein
VASFSRPLGDPEGFAISPADPRMRLTMSNRQCGGKVVDGVDPRRAGHKLLHCRGQEVVSVRVQGGVTRGDGRVKGQTERIRRVLGEAR